MNAKSKFIPSLLLVVILAAVIIVFRSLAILSTVLLVAAGAYALLHQQESADSRRLPWQTWLLAILSVAIYLVNWLVLGH